MLQQEGGIEITLEMLTVLHFVPTPGKRLFNIFTGQMIIFALMSAGLISTTFGSPRDLHFCRNISISMAGALLAMDFPNRFLLRGFPVFSDITVFFARCVREDHSIFST